MECFQEELARLGNGEGFTPNSRNSFSNRSLGGLIATLLTSVAVQGIVYALPSSSQSAPYQTAVDPYEKLARDNLHKPGDTICIEGSTGARVYSFGSMGMHQCGSGSDPTPLGDGAGKGVCEYGPGSSSN